MALNVKKGTITSPGSTGNQAITGVGFTPKAIIFWGAQQTADGRTHGNALLIIGAATRDGGSTQQWYNAVAEDDAAANSSGGGAFNTTAAYKGVTDANPTIDSVFTLTSFDADGFTINWSDLPGTASQVIHYFAIGGSDVTAARCGSFTLSTAAATQNVTVNTGFGQPDLLFFVPLSFTTLGDATNQGLLASFGAAISATERRVLSVKSPWNQATMDVASWHKARAIVSYNTSGSSTPTADAEADLSAKGSWPTDGFQLSYTDQAAAAAQVFYIALKGTFTATIGSNTAPTAVAPQTQDLALASGTPAGALLWGAPIAGNTALTTSATDLGGFFLGGTDGTTEGVAGFTNQDAATDEVTGRFHSTGKAIQFCTFAGTTTAAPDLDSEADSSISGSNIRLTWGDTDSVAREYSYLLLGSSASGDANVTPGTAAGTGTLVAPAISASSTVTSPTCAGTGALPAPGVGTSMVVLSPVMGGSGGLPAPVASAGSAIAPGPAAGTGALVAPALSAGATIAPGPIAGTGAIPAPLVSSGASANVSPGPMAATGTVPAPIGSGAVNLTAAAAAATGAVVSPTLSAGVTITSSPAAGTGTLPTPLLAAGATISTTTCAGTGDVVSPTISGGVTITVTPASGTGDLVTPSAAGTGSALLTPPVMDATGTFPVPVITGSAFQTPSRPGLVSPAARTGSAAPHARGGLTEPYARAGVTAPYTRTGTVSPSTIEAEV